MRQPHHLHPANCKRPRRPATCPLRPAAIVVGPPGNRSMATIPGVAMQSASKNAPMLIAGRSSNICRLPSSAAWSRPPASTSPGRRLAGNGWRDPGTRPPLATPAQSGRQAGWIRQRQPHRPTTIGHAWKRAGDNRQPPEPPAGRWRGTTSTAAARCACGQIAPGALPGHWATPRRTATRATICAGSDSYAEHGAAGRQNGLLPRQGGGRHLRQHPLHVGWLGSLRVYYNEPASTGRAGSARRANATSSIYLKATGCATDWVNQDIDHQSAAEPTTPAYHIQDPNSILWWTSSAPITTLFHNVLVCLTPASGHLISSHLLLARR